MNPWRFALFHHLAVFRSHFYCPSFLSCKYLRVPVGGPHAPKVSDDGNVFLFQKKSLGAQDMRWPILDRKTPVPLRVCIMLRSLGTCDVFSRRKRMKLSTFYIKSGVRMFFQKSVVLTVFLLWHSQLLNSKGALPPGGKSIEGVTWSPGENTEKPIYVAWTVLPWQWHLTVW